MCVCVCVCVCVRESVCVCVCPLFVTLSDSWFSALRIRLTNSQSMKPRVTVFTVMTSPRVSFSYQRKVVVLPWNMSESKSSQISKTLLNIQADFNNAVVWRVSILFRFPIDTVFSPSLWEPFQAYELQLVSL